ncbi:MAG: hypothetical protein N2Z73_00920 [Endomicrobia bacterium]|nr:hypothetical protein [Endomicrobiia bacterium]
MKVKINKVKINSFFILILFFGCATQFTYYSTIKSFISSGQYDNAISLMDENKFKEYGEKNELLYWLDKGIVLHYAGKYEESIFAFEKAEKLAEELYTKSISEEAATFLTSDNARSYAGEDFERIFINIFLSLNYLLLNRYENALVEARKVDHKLKTLQVNYAGKNVYKEDAFMRYLTGLLYESQNELNDAFVSYRKSIKEFTENNKIYPFGVPQDLLYRSLKLAKRLYMKEEFKEIATKFNLNLDYENFVYDKNNGELIILHYNGFAPYKIDHYIEVTFGEGWTYVGSIQVAGDAEKDLQKARRIARGIASTEQFLVAFPKFVPSPSNIKYGVINIYDEKMMKVCSLNTYTVEDIETIAIKNLEDRISLVKAKTIARAAVKYALSRAVSQKLTENSDELSKWLVKKVFQTAATATEQADKRSWRTLPKEINFATAELKPGRYRIECLFYDKENNFVQKKVYENITINSGKKTFITVRTSI